MKKITEIQWYRVFIGILLLIIILMIFKMNAKVDITNNLDKLLTKDCFSEEDLSFTCEYTNAGNFIPIKEDNKKYWSCIVNNTAIYSVEAC